MFNNLGIFFRIRNSVARRRLVRPAPIYGVGQIGNDIFYNSSSSGYTGSRGYTGSTGYTGSQGIPGIPGGFTGSQGITGFIGSFGFTGSQGDIGFTGSQGSLIVPVTVVTSLAPYVATSADYYIAMSVPAPSIVNLPLGTTGEIFIVKDALGTAGAPFNYTITVSDITTIDGVASKVINTNFGSLSFIFNGTEWNLF